MPTVQDHVGRRENLGVSIRDSAPGPSLVVAHSIAPGKLSGVVTTAERPSVRSGLASLRRARELFLLGRQLPDGAPEEVVAAWKRARFFGVRHDVKEPAPEHSVRPPVSPLLTAARPVL